MNPYLIIVAICFACLIVLGYVALWRKNEID